MFPNSSEPGLNHITRMMERRAPSPVLTHVPGPTSDQILRSEDYRSSSMHCSNTSRLGRVTDSGSVARGCSVILSSSRNDGAFGLT